LKESKNIKQSLLVERKYESILVGKGRPTFPLKRVYFS